MIEPLLYSTGKEMSVEPINITMDSLVWGLSHNVPYVANLEPGDATHYSLLLVPAGGVTICENFGRWGVPADRASEYIIAIKMDDRDLRGCWIPTFEPTDPHHVASLSPNEWSRAFLAWWFRHLLEELEKL